MKSCLVTWLASKPAAADILVQHVENQRLMNETLKAEMDKGGPTWTWAWRPGWMWLLAFVWLYALILRPLTNAALGASIEAVDLTILMTLRRWPRRGIAACPARAHWKRARHR